MAEEYKFPPYGAYQLPGMAVMSIGAGDVAGSVHLVFQTQFGDQKEPLTLVLPITTFDAAKLQHMLKNGQDRGLLPTDAEIRGRA